MILRLFILSVCIGAAMGFMCYACSYGGTDADKPATHHDCLNNLDNLPITTHIKCGNFCVTQEVFDKSKKIVTSFTRTCSVDWGNSCTEDAWWVTCKTTCVGDYCNKGFLIDPESKEEPKVCDPYYGCGGHNPFNGSSRKNGQLFVIMVVLLIGELCQL